MIVPLFSRLSAICLFDGERASFVSASSCSPLLTINSSAEGFNISGNRCVECTKCPICLLDQLIANGNFHSNLVLNIEKRRSILGVSDIEERK